LLFWVFFIIAFSSNQPLIVFFFCRRRKNWNENHVRDEW
jgi:hypothetical protein